MRSTRKRRRQRESVPGAPVDRKVTSAALRTLLERRHGGSFHNLARTIAGSNTELFQRIGCQLFRAQQEQKGSVLRPSLAKEILRVEKPPENAEEERAFAVIKAAAEGEEPPASAPRLRRGRRGKQESVGAPDISFTRPGSLKVQAPATGTLHIAGMGLNFIVQLSYDAQQRQLVNGNGNPVVVPEGDAFVLKVPLTAQAVLDLLIAK